MVYVTFGLRRQIGGVRMFQASNLPVQPEEPLDVALDGEVCGRLPGTFDVIPGGLRVVTSAGFGER